MEFNREDVDIRVIDQRIGAGVGGLNTVIRLLHRPTGIIVEIPELKHKVSQHRRLNSGMEAINYMLLLLDAD